jgi:hypothetical protein
MCILCVGMNVSQVVRTVYVSIMGHVSGKIMTDIVPVAQKIVTTAIMIDAVDLTIAMIAG